MFYFLYLTPPLPSVDEDEGAKGQSWAMNGREERGGVPLVTKGMLYNTKGKRTTRVHWGRPFMSALGFRAGRISN